ncbi:uncharacterized protein LOC128021137 isoform X2 [Carassius gibelio]|uniref:uncharacterized protein LOC128021137 isoform X2 n=1 Tax=Carassius gibelio TaxID=101364 RepID=UPI0022793734|nr:uncharacterized protein LOC128021137 isoform X2 [Carassius gibelio]
MCFPLIFCGWMMFSSVFAFGDVAVNRTKPLCVNRGQSAKIRCNYSRTNDTESMTAALQTLNLTLCSYYFFHNTWKEHHCKDSVRFTWIPETKDMTFELLNLQIQDTGTYTCSVKRIVKPPEVDLGVQRVQMWIRDGDVLNSSYSNKSFNGSFSHQSYLILPPQTFNDTIYSCWVNHPSLNKPLVANVSSSVCYESDGVSVIGTVVFVMLIVTLTVFLIALVICKHYRRTCQQSVSVTVEPVLPDPLQSEILYSTLGDHHPVRCSPSDVRSIA